MATVLTVQLTPGDVLAAGEVAAILGVDVTTVIRREAAGRLPALLRTPAGHRRWHRLQAEASRDGQPPLVIRLAPLPEWMTTAEVAAAFGVDMLTVRRWTYLKVLPAPGRTPGGHARHRGAEIAAVMRGEKAEGASS